MKSERRADGTMVCPFDHHTPEYNERFDEIIAALRAEAPLAWSDNYGGFWIATSHELVRRLVRESENLQLNQVKGVMEGGLHIPVSPGAVHRKPFVPGEADGEPHDRYRLALNPLFSRQKVTELQPLIDRHVAQVIDRVLAQGEFDVIEELVGPILAGIACEYLGLEVEHPRAFFKDLFQLVSYSEHSGAELGDVRREFDRAWIYLVEVVADRRTNPRDDVISHLTQSQDPEFTDEEVQQMTLNVILGAADTTGTLVSQALMYMDQHLEVRRLLSEDPELAAPAVDEFLRLISPAMNVGRTVMADVQVDGVTLKQGDRILLSYYGANHDPARYPNPNVFDLDRGSSQHMGLGLGEHFCLGAWLAKAIATTTIRETLRRIPDYHIDHDRAEKPAERTMLNRYVTMPAQSH